MDELLQEFLVESHEHLDRMEADLMALERSPTDTELLASVFRALHTIKGTCGFFGLPRLEELTHAGEEVLARLRAGDLRFGYGIANTLLRVVDVVRGILAEVERSGGEGEPAVAPLVGELEQLRGAEAPEAPAEGAEASATAPQAKNLAPRAVRVDVQLLDSLMNLVGELVLARNRLLQCPLEREATLALQQLTHITTELQESILKTRMEPIGRLWDRFPRLVRDLASAVGKKATLETYGHQTELDRALLEAIGDPLTHLVRNSLDHGIEDPVAREEKGKTAAGRLVLRAYHDAGDVVVEVQDDGAGMDPERIRGEAIAKGLLSSADADALNDREALRLVFRPGFSTAARVTSVSGRGVGMDVVLANIGSVGGAVDLESNFGRGTKVRIRLPATLAILPGLVVTVAGERFVVPENSVRELVIAEAKDVHLENGVTKFGLRGQRLPLLRLATELGFPDAADEGAVAILGTDRGRYALLVDRILDRHEIVVKPLPRPLRRSPVFAGATILGDGGIALVLDVARFPVRAGIVPHLAERRSRPRDERDGGRQAPHHRLLLFESPDDGRVVVPIAPIARLEEFPNSAIETASGGAEFVAYGGRMIPLFRISRILPERRTRPRRAKTLGPREGETIHVAIYTHRDRSVGLVVDRVIDIVEVQGEIKEPGPREGVRGTIQVGDRIAEYLDVEGIVRRARPGFFE